MYGEKKKKEIKNMERYAGYVKDKKPNRKGIQKDWGQNGDTPVAILQALNVIKGAHDFENVVTIKKFEETKGKYVHWGLYNLENGNKIIPLNVNKDRNISEQELKAKGAFKGGDSLNDTWYITVHEQNVGAHPLAYLIDAEETRKGILKVEYNDKKSFDTHVFYCETFKEAVKQIKVAAKTQEIKTYSVKVWDDKIIGYNKFQEMIEGAYAHKETYRASDHKNITKIFLDPKKIETYPGFNAQPEAFLEKFKIHTKDKTYYIEKGDYTVQIERFRPDKKNTIGIQARKTLLDSPKSVVPHKTPKGIKTQHKEIETIR